ncbi:50S ribosomal protein L24 [archaeon]|nr:50S ribosomal protein L24 [archaeon]NCP79578.1 50S ribosomal protein L24 [archaeon]NCP98351.1 50S ribosomal protein L24 [archaeon]NCQ07345.1 50S ribosomal protein L24 [archaeon]NCQ51141.1 50S ribosomal protein L24 [archaeon]
MNKKITKNPGKQRLKIYKGPLHTKRKLLACPLDKPLQKKYDLKSILIRKGDTVKVMVGDEKGKSGKVEIVDHAKAKVFVKDIKYKNSRGQEKMYPLVASNLLITDLVVDDLKRFKKKKTPEKKGGIND